MMFINCFKTIFGDVYQIWSFFINLEFALFIKEELFPKYEGNEYLFGIYFRFRKNLSFSAKVKNYSLTFKVEKSKI